MMGCVPRTLDINWLSEANIESPESSRRHLSGHMRHQLKQIHAGLDGTHRDIPAGIPMPIRLHARHDIREAMLQPKKLDKGVRDRPQGSKQPPKGQDVLFQVFEVDIDKPGLPQHVLVGALLKRILGMRQAEDFLQHRGVGVVVGFVQEQHSAWLQEAVEVSQDSVRVVGVHERFHGVDAVEGAVLQVRQVVVSPSSTWTPSSKPRE
jgi:hypothetical protein